MHKGEKSSNYLRNILKGIISVTENSVLQEIRKDGTVKRYSTHPLSVTYGGSPTAGSYQYGGNPWEPRIINQDVGATQAMSDLGVEIVPQVVVVLADPDRTIYTVESTKGFKGAIMRLYAVMWDAGDTATGSFSSDSPAPVKFIGTCGSPTFDDRTLTITATSLLNMGQMQIPPIRIQKRCSWTFPGTLSDKSPAFGDSSSIFYACGYSYGIGGGVGPGRCSRTRRRARLSDSRLA